MYCGGTFKKQAIYNILTQKTIFVKPVLDQNFFDVDLVIKLKLPTSRYIDKIADIPLSQIVYNPSKGLQQAYAMAMQRMLEQMEENEQMRNQKLIKIRNQVNFVPTAADEEFEKQYQALLINGMKTPVVFPCHIKCQSSLIDSFMIKFNTLVYLLQNNCGFQVRSFIQEENQSLLSKSQQKKENYVYLLISQNTPNLMKAADRFKIKKEVDYSQLDLFLNQPVDDLGRPYQNNTQFLKQRQIQKQLLEKFQKLNGNEDTKDTKLLKLLKEKLANNLINKEKDNYANIQIKKTQSQFVEQQTKFKRKKSQNLSRASIKTTQQQNQLLKQNEVVQLYKRVHRNMKDKNYYLDNHVIQQKKMSKSQKQKITDYMANLFFQLDIILRQKIQLAAEQKDYIYEINRKKTNPKCEKEYILKIKRKRFFAKMKQLSKKYGYQTYHTPATFFPFVLPSKKLSFIQRLRGIFLYEEYKVTPYGDLSIFSKMDRIKLAYLTMREFIRTQNINKIDGEIFALQNSYELFGSEEPSLVHRDSIHKIQGGINGKNVIDSWNPLTPWKIDLVTLRNYFGECTVYQIYIKNHLILLFMVLAPLGLLGQISLRLFVYYNKKYNDYEGRGFSSTHKEQLIFYLIFFLISLGILTYFLEKWIGRQKQFKDNFVEDTQSCNFRFSYKGPFVRNTVSDSVNEHIVKADFFSNLKRFMFILLHLVILAAEAGFFFGMRMSIIELAIIFPRKNFYLISWAHILCYGIFFVVNLLLFNFVIEPLNRKLTKLENISTQKAHKNSLKSKNFIFLIGIEIIGPLFFLIFQPFAYTSCFAASCHEEFTQYIYSRYIIVFFLLGIKLISFLIIYSKSGISKLKHENMVDSRVNTIEFDQKVQAFTNLITKQSKKPNYQPEIYDETLALLLYGMFATSFPLSPILSLASVILEYLIERVQLIQLKKRPISRGQATDKFTQKFILILHLSIFINCWIVFYTLQQVEYTFQRWIRVFVGDMPTLQGILVLKLIVIIVTIILYEIYVLIIRYLVQESSDKVLNMRKNRKFKKFLLSKNYTRKTKFSLQTKKIHPFRTIFRTYHKQLIDKFMKNNKNKDLLIQQQQQQQSSSHFISKIKK